MERGEREQALRALFYGAHTRPTEKKVWDDVAELILRRAGDDHLSAVRDAIYCYNRILGLDPQDADARRHRAVLNRELGNATQSLADYKRLLHDSPQDVEALRRLVELYTESNEAAKAIEAFDVHLSHFQSSHIQAFNPFEWSDLNVYAELCGISQIPSVAIKKLKRFARWLLGRLEEQYWDEYTDDDREYDGEDQPRRMQVSEFSSSKYAMGTYGLGLPLELRVKLGIFRLNVGSTDPDDDLKEAMVCPISFLSLIINLDKSHFDWLEPNVTHPASKLFDYPDLFREVGDALRKREYFVQALRFYEPLKMVNLAVGRPYFQNMAHCYEELQMFDKAELCYELILEHDASSTDIRLHLTNMLEVAGLPERVSKQLAKFGPAKAGHHLIIMDSKRHPENFAMSTAEMQVPSSSHLTLSTIKGSKRKAFKPIEPKESLESLHDLDESWLQMKLAKEGLRQDITSSWSGWMVNAQIVTDNFRSQPSFFPSERNTRFSGYRDGVGKSLLNTAAGLQRVDDHVTTQSIGGQATCDT